MEIFFNSKELTKQIKTYKKRDLKIGFVPTMGALHEGHLSLIRKSVKDNDITVVSIFVNPLQFGPTEDFDKYPREFEKDKEKCQKEGVNIIFLPDESKFYFPDHSTYVEVKKLEDHLCGKSRPGHFKGVCTVVSKLFNIVQPDRAYFGKKDYQQLKIIQRMVRDLSFDIEIIPMPIVREEDGLAMSSRNKYLTTEERKDALLINKALNKALEVIKKGQRNSYIVKNIIKEIIFKGKYNKIDYISIVDDETLEDKNEIDRNTLIAIACFTGKTRLIDNLHLKEYL